MFQHHYHGTVSCAALVTLVLAITAAAQAGAVQPIFWDDFQSDTAVTGNSPTDADPVIGTGDTGGSWLIDEASSVYVQVLNTNPVDDFSSGAVAGPNHYLKLIRSSAGNGIALALPTSADASATQNALVDMSFRLFVHNFEDGAKAAHFGAENNTTTTFNWQQRSVDVRFDQGGTIHSWDGTTVNETGLTHVPGQWNDVRVLADMKSGAFSLTVNDQTRSGLPFAGTADGLQKLFFGQTGTQPVRYFIDDVSTGIVASPSDPNIFFLESFDTDVAGVGTPSSSDYHPVIGATDVGAEWQVTGTAGLVQVLNTDPAGDITGPFTAGDNGYLMIRKGGVAHGLFAPGSAAGTEDRVVPVSFRLFNTSDTSSGSSIAMALLDATGTDISAGKRSVELRFLGNGDVQYFDHNISGSGFNTGLDHTLDEWNDVTLLVDYSEQTFDLTITNSLGTSSVTGLEWTNGVNRVQKLALYGTGPVVLGLFDDFRVIPEPGSAVLLALGALGLLLWRRRRNA